eukprot:12439054-Alexandrium_andersonii.AAC.1
MSASLVGSEMCIRDRALSVAAQRTPAGQDGAPAGKFEAGRLPPERWGREPAPRAKCEASSSGRLVAAACR